MVSCGISLFGLSSDIHQANFSCPNFFQDFFSAAVPLALLSQEDGVMASVAKVSS